MVCDICKDAVFLAQKAAPATAEDLGAAHTRRGGLPVSDRHAENQTVPDY